MLAFGNRSLKTDFVRLSLLQGAKRGAASRTTVTQRPRSCIQAADDEGPSTSYGHLEPAWRRPTPLHGGMSQRRTWARFRGTAAVSASLGGIGKRATRGLLRAWQPLQRLWHLLASHPSIVHYRDIISRAVLTLAMLVIIRLGYFIALPGVDMMQVPARSPSGEQGELLIKALYGQAGELPTSIFDLGISPFINASILTFVLFMVPVGSLGPLPPWLDKLLQARKEGKQGEAYITAFSNKIAMVLALYLAVLRAFELEPYALLGGAFVLKASLALMGGSAILHHCANTITAHGIGNGTTLVIVTGIASEYAGTLHQVLSGMQSGALGLQQLGVGLAGYLAILCLSVFMSLSELRLPMVHYSRTPAEPSKSGDMVDPEAVFVQARQLLDKKAVEHGAQPTYYPILLNSSGMMPVIFAGSFWFFLYPKLLELLGLYGAAAQLYALQSSAAGLLVYGMLVFLVEFITPATQATDIAEYMEQTNMGIKGVPPGEQTVQHIKLKNRQVKFWGGLAMAFLAVVAYLFDQLCKEQVGATLATTSTLILVGAVLQTSRQVESLLQAPRLQQQLEQERAVIQSLSFL